MHRTIYKTFGEILERLAIRGPVLEIGAVPNSKSLLAHEVLRQTYRVGVNLQGGSFQDFDIVECNGNYMPMFADGYFDCVVSNATIEHDKCFWKTCAEIRRVLQPGGAAVIGGPAFTAETGLKALGMAPAWAEDDTRSWAAAALTYRYHAAPDDYYRFSPSAFRDVIFEGFSDVRLEQLTIPPRIIGYGFRE